MENVSAARVGRSSSIQFSVFVKDWVSAVLLPEILDGRGPLLETNPNLGPLGGGTSAEGRRQDNARKDREYRDHCEKFDQRKRLHGRDSTLTVPPVILARTRVHRYCPKNGVLP